jgi:hypothetical protein
MLLQYGLLKDKQIMAGNYPKFDFLFYELFFTLITHRVGRWKTQLGLKGGKESVCPFSSEAVPGKDRAGIPIPLE